MPVRECGTPENTVSDFTVQMTQANTSPEWIQLPEHPENKTIRKKLRSFKIRLRGDRECQIRKSSVKKKFLVLCDNDGHSKQ